MPESEAAAQSALPAPPATELVGIDQQRASQLLGPATTTDSRTPVTVWHYKSSRCERSISFSTSDFKSGDDNPEQRRACLKTITEENLKSAATDGEAPR
jgi:hypothetical protein